MTQIPDIRGSVKRWFEFAPESQFLRAARVQNETAPEKTFKSIRKAV